MPKIIYTAAAGTQHDVDVDTGVSAMRAAILNGVDGIVGECGGQAMCATCHVFVESSDRPLPNIGDDEDEMLDCTVEDRLENSRLGCQLKAGDDFDELVVRLPESQV